MTPVKQWVAKAVDLLPGTLPIQVGGALRRARYPQLRHAHRARRTIYRKIGSPQLIMQGPFKGMKYLSRSYHSMLLPKLLGTYEVELASTIERIVSGRPDLIVDLGAAEGYYAVGLAIRSPTSRVVAYELYPPARRLLRELAELNSVADRVTILGAGTWESLNQQLANATRPALICDIEGAEDELLDPKQVPALGRCVILIEVHEGYRAPRLQARLEERFAPTHEFQVIHSRAREFADLPAGVALNDVELAAASDEGRVIGLWLFFTPRETS